MSTSEAASGPSVPSPRSDQSGVSFPDPTNDTPENRSIAEAASDRWDAPVTASLEEVMVRYGLNPETGEPTDS